MPKFEHDTIVPDKFSQLGKKQQVAGMFDDIAGRYDFFNRFLSFGIDIWWRKKAIAQLASLQPKKILDVATGTADVALMMYKKLQPEKIIGIDISEGMLELGRKKIDKMGWEKQIELVVGDSEKINFSDSSFDAVTVAFGVRNFEDLEKGLTEIHRVLQPGGKLIVLEFSKPGNGLFNMLCRFYTGVIGPGIVQLFSKNKSAYKYLNDSVRAFPEGQDFINLLQNAGFTHTYLQPLSGGICTVYCGSK